jgi:hypothetical protein
MRRPRRSARRPTRPPRTQSGEDQAARRSLPSQTAVLHGDGDAGRRLRRDRRTRSPPEPGRVRHAHGSIPAADPDGARPEPDRTLDLRQRVDLGRERGLSPLSNDDAEITRSPPNELDTDSSTEAWTDDTNVSRAMVKLRARDRAQLVVFAYESGLVRPGWAG